VLKKIFSLEFESALAPGHVSVHALLKK